MAKTLQHKLEQLGKEYYDWRVNNDAYRLLTLKNINYFNYLLEISKIKYPNATDEEITFHAEIEYWMII